MINNDKQIFKLFPKNKKQLVTIINKQLGKFGPNCDLTDIDTSRITDMSNLFKYSNFNGDISNWDVSNVRTMQSMFEYSKFNGDISNWNVSRVKDMSWMFMETEFNQDISK